jgi:SAM-dependent methyltransferase
MLERVRTRVRYLLKSGIKRKVRDFAAQAPSKNTWVLREDLARRYLEGDGIEIGALSWPLRVPPGARVRYVDHATREELVRLYGAGLPAQGGHPDAIPHTDVVDDGERLATFADGSVDFVIANHVLEHMQDPIACLQHLLRVLRPGGILFLALPDARFSFDKPRERTTVEHLQRDHREGPEISRRDHYVEWARDIEGRGPDDIEWRAKEFAEQDARNHFHNWELDGFLEFVLAVDFPATIELAQVNQAEFVVILRKTD